MIKVLFFGRVREVLGCDKLSLPWGDESADLKTLQATLCSRHGEKWSEVLGQDNIICAVNQEVAGPDQVLADGDEVAFFPPVTGG